MHSKFSGVTGMDVKSSYVPSHFLAMFCPKEETNGDNREFYNDFLSIAKAQPDILSNTDSFIVYLIHSPSTRIAVDHENRVTLILHGEIYNTGDRQAEFLLKQFIEQGISFSKNINGSFAVLLIDERNDGVMLITDRINSRKVFYSKYKDCYWLSTSLNLHPTGDVDVDPIGVAHYLASGAVHNNRTLFDGIRVLERACIHKLREDGFDGMRYWSYEFNNSYSNVSERELRDELSELLIQSIKIRLKDDPRVFLSLSGGYDSATILGILSELEIANIDCFSYALGRPKSNSDEYVAREMANWVGFNHRIIQVEDSNIANLIEHGVRLGRGMLPGNFDEIATYIKMNRDFFQNLPSSLFVADECFGWLDRQLSDDITLMNCVRVYGFDVLSWLQNYMSVETYRMLNDALRNDLVEILKRCPGSDDYHNNKDFLYLDQRLSNFILPWREFLAGQFVNVRNPFLDNSILDFMMKLPSSLRRGKYLYIQTITQMFPDLFRFRRASTCSYVINWRRALVSEHNSIKRLVESQDSMLDEIITPREIINLMERGESLITLSPKSKMIRSARRFLRETRLNGTFVERNLSRFFHKHPLKENVDLSTFLRRVLVARRALVNKQN